MSKINNEDGKELFSSNGCNDNEQIIWLQQKDSYNRLKDLTAVQFYKSVKEHISQNSDRSPSVVKDSLKFNQDILKVFQSSNPHSISVSFKQNFNLWDVPVARHIFFGNMDNLQNYVFKDDIVSYMIYNFHPNSKNFAYLDDFLNHMDIDTAIAFHKDKVNNYPHYPLYMMDYFYAQKDETLAKFFILKIDEIILHFNNHEIVSYIEDYAIANFPDKKNTFKVSQDCLDILLQKCEELKIKFNLNNSKKPTP